MKAFIFALLTFGGVAFSSSTGEVKAMEGIYEDSSLMNILQTAHNNALVSKNTSKLDQAARNALICNSCNEDIGEFERLAEEAQSNRACTPCLSTSIEEYHPVIKKYFYDLGTFFLEVAYLAYPSPPKSFWSSLISKAKNFFGLETEPSPSEMLRESLQGDLYQKLCELGKPYEKTALINGYISEVLDHKSMQSLVQQLYQIVAGKKLADTP
jgi:hypothetical protein